MTEPAPPDVVSLAQDRATARAARDFAAADRLRDAIAELGWVVADSASGFTLRPKPPYDVLASVRELPDNSAAPDRRAVTVSVLVDGRRAHLRRCAARAHPRRRRRAAARPR
jgi:CRISPR/Cas system-associated endonuclease Cas3-HD